jgi:hypothetical protein
MSRLQTDNREESHEDIFKNVSGESQSASRRRRMVTACAVSCRALVAPGFFIIIIDPDSSLFSLNKSTSLSKDPVTDARVCSTRPKNGSLINDPIL